MANSQATSDPLGSTRLPFPHPHPGVVAKPGRAVSSPCLASLMLLAGKNFHEFRIASQRRVLFTELETSAKRSHSQATVNPLGSSELPPS